ncbi:hypothetical protein BsWGS_09918 [Bradybaena similaris]
MMTEDNQCGRSLPSGVQFVDESAIEIDIADDDAVCGEKEKRVDCANILVSLSHRRGDESVDNEFTRQAGGQFEAAVENELTPNNHHMMSRPLPQTETFQKLRLRRPRKNRRVKGKVKRKRKDRDATKAAYFVDETAVEIDVAHDDSSDSVVVIVDDSDDGMDSERSLDVVNFVEYNFGSQHDVASASHEHSLSEHGSSHMTTSMNLVEYTFDSRNDVASALQENSLSKQGSSDVTTFMKSADNGAVLLDTMAPVVSQSPTISRSQEETTPDLCDESLLLEYNLQRLKTMSSQDSARFPEIVFDEFDVEHLRKPFHCGWRRELVCRRTGSKSKDRLCDVYYKSPEGKKLRSKVEIATYLLSATNSPVNLTHFTYKRVLLFNPPFETVRLAGFKRPRMFVGQSNSRLEKKRQSQDCSSEGNISTDQMPTPNKLAAKDNDTAGTLASLSSIQAKSSVAGQGTAEKEDIPADRLSTSLLTVLQASELSQAKMLTQLPEKPAHPDFLKNYL